MAGGLAWIERPVGAREPGESANVLGYVSGASEDGSYVYFVADDVLAEEANPGNCHDSPAETTCNLYVRHNGVTTFIAALSDGDAKWGAFADEAHFHLSARVSPNGRFLASCLTAA